MEEIQLSLHKNYVSEWDVKYAIREIIQNIKDNPSEEIINIDKGVLYLGNVDGKLDKKTLLLGNSSKLTNDTIGKFGEGYKLALLVLLRSGITTTIFTNDEIWSCSFKKHYILDEDVLTINISKNNTIVNGILFKIDGINEDYSIEELLDSLLLSSQRYKKIYDGEDISIYENFENEDKGKIFVNGMFITKISNFEYCYDFKPDILEFGRDRNIVDEFEVCYATSKTWSEVQDSNRVIKSMKNNSPEIRFIHNWKSKIKSDIIDCLALEYENYIPVSYNDEIARTELEYETGKYKFKVVPEFIKQLLPKKKLVKKKYLSNKDFYTKYRRYFSKQMLRDWKKIK